MKVLILHAQLGILQGGGESFVKNLFTAFAGRGHKLSAAFVANPWGRWPVAIPRCIEPIPISGWWSPNLGQGVLSSLGQYLPAGTRYRQGWDRVQNALDWRIFRWHGRRFQRRVEREFVNRWNQFDVIYVQANVMLAAKIAEYQPTILMLPGPVGPELEPWLRKVHAVCAHDDGFARMQAILGDNVLEIPLGLNTRLFSPGPSSIRSTLGWTDQHEVVGYVGRLHRIKGVDLLSTAFHELSQKLPNARLLIVGAGKQEKSMRSALANEIAHGIAHLEPAKDQEQLPCWYRAMDLMVMPSRYETMSNAVLEAMACGIPFLASDVGGNRTLGKTGAGWLFESESVSSLSDCLHSIIIDRAEMRARGQIGLLYVQQHRSWARSAERLEQILTSRLKVAV